ncbi:hypothetical protein [Thermomonospora umbrina]|uniref:Uncharacterized protein n=1 Tax=Thermomonospora umbrina TaxID=111806 RepID=A0A3D9SVV6_9ACTN|nr:hypothetical protein [Thermomonospora umbrina]REF00090.1 hypothetical protein DFJ69_5616 [Thermomonospora umbrina]
MARTISEERVDLAHLDDLGRALTARGFLTMIVTAGTPRLEVLNRTDPERFGTVLCQGGDDRWFWWSWADRIAPAADLEDAAALVERALSAPGTAA